MHCGLYRLNNIVLNCRLNALNRVSSRKSASKLLHIRVQQQKNSFKSMYITQTGTTGKTGIRKTVFACAVN